MCTRECSPPTSNLRPDCYEATIQPTARVKCAHEWIKPYTFWYCSSSNNFEKIWIFTLIIFYNTCIHIHGIMKSLARKLIILCNFLYKFISNINRVQKYNCRYTASTVDRTQAIDKSVLIISRFVRGDPIRFPPRVCRRRNWLLSRVLECARAGVSSVLKNTTRWTTFFFLDRLHWYLSFTACRWSVNLGGSRWRGDVYCHYRSSYYYVVPITVRRHSFVCAPITLLIGGRWPHVRHVDAPLVG